MKKLLACFLVTMIVCTDSFAYPISPRPLRKLIIESEYIVIAHVVDIREKRSKKKNDWEGFVAELMVRDVLQGKLKDTVLQITYSPYMICPAPAHFEKGTEVLVFLNKTNDRFYVNALSYGAKTLSEADLVVYTTRIREMQAILKIEDKDEQFIQTADWLVKCAEDPATRYEGIYELSPGSNFMSYYDKGEQQPFQFALNANQMERLKKALFASASLNYDELGIIDLIYSSDPVGIYGFMHKNLSSISEDNYWMAGEVMKRMMYYKTSPQLEKLVSEFESKIFDLKDGDQDIKLMLAKFVAEIEKL
jgi:hypothetical protein